MKRARLDKLLVERGLAPSRERARALIAAGQVEVGGLPVDKPAAQVDPGTDIRLREADHPYVSRGALKLVAALDAWSIDPTGLVALDVGASTGGFTDLLVRRGAARVYAIDVGYGQLAWSLRADPRVVVLERENIRHLAAEKIPEPADLAVIDVSFISLELVLDKVAELMQPRSERSPPEPAAGSNRMTPWAPPGGKPIVCLVKPQFEVGRDKVGKGGVVRDPETRASALDKIRAFAAGRGFAVGPAIDSPIAGPAGNLEYLLLLHTPA